MTLNLAMICVALMGLGLAASDAAAQPKQAPKPEIPLWPQQDLVRLPKPEQTYDITHVPGKLDRGIRLVSEPTITVCLPEHVAGPTPAVVICPGGGYSILAIDREGFDEARFLNGLGIAAFVLKYRLPHPDLAAKHHDALPWPQEDALQAMRMVRSRAKLWNIDPHKVGIMGFSAGGHLAAWVETHFDAGDPDATDPIARQSSRPDFGVLVYALISLRDPYTIDGCRVNLLGRNVDASTIESYSSETQVTAKTPPTFLAQAKDDKTVKPINAQMFYDALKKAGVETELHLYNHGGHGFGMGAPNLDSAQWPHDLAQWLVKIKVIGSIPKG